MSEIETISDVSGFHTQLHGLEWENETGLLYRGQAKASREVDCSAIRRLKKDPILDKSLKEYPALEKGYLTSYLRSLIDKARTRGFLPESFDKQPSDLELMAQLQHQGAATGLIDFTRQPLVALWFACNKYGNKAKQEDREDGAVYVLPRSKIEEIEEKHLHEEIKYFYEQSELWSWDTSALGNLNRIVAQSSVLVFGMSAIEKSEMKRLIIGKHSKDAIIKELEILYGINEETLFSDFSGYAMANSMNKTLDTNRTIQSAMKKISGTADPQDIPHKTVPLPPTPVSKKLK